MRSRFASATSKLPNGPGSAGSRVTASIVPPLILAAGKLKAGVAEKTGRQPPPGSNAPWRDLIAASPDFKVEAERAEDNPRTIYGNNSLLKDAGMIGWIFGFMLRRSSHVAVGAGAPSSLQVVEVEVDTALGHVRVMSAHSGLAVGKLAAPALARSQAAGAIVQGLGYALYEGREVDSVTGDVLTTSLDDYRMPGIADIPPIDLYFDEGGFDHVQGGSVGIGEVATVPTSAAIANAIRNAIGVRPCEIPLRPDRLLGLHRAQERRMTAIATIVASQTEAEFRASGTDLSERRRSGVSRGPLIDILPSPDMIGHRLERLPARRGSALRRRSPRSPATPASRRPIRESPPRPAVWRRRKSGAWPRSAAISHSAPAAGIFAIRRSTARRRAAKPARRARATTSMASPSISARASRLTPRPWRRPSWLMTRRLEPTCALP